VTNCVGYDKLLSHERYMSSTRELDKDVATTVRVLKYLFFVYFNFL
jgi:hypothetical protein